MFVFKADTPDELKIEIIKWLMDNSHNHMLAASIANRKTFKKEQIIIANVYQDTANFMQRCKIETKS